MLLHTRHNHDLPTYVAFVDLVKEFDTVDHNLMLPILKKYGAPPKLRSSITRMYQDLKVVLKIGKTKETMSQIFGVIQGYCMTPVLLLFMVMAFAETLEKEWTKSGLSMITLQQRSRSPQDTDNLTGHKVKTFSQGNLLTLFCVLYVDDGAFHFENRLQLELVLSLIHNHFIKFGLEMHIGRGNKASKTEYIFFPPTGFFLQKEIVSHEINGENMVSIRRSKQVKRGLHAEAPFLHNQNVPRVKSRSQDWEN